jgi:sulfhydrogenase subunit beta (sulfur reductase)
VSEQFLRREDLQRLIEALRREFHQVIGPRVRDGTVVFDDVEKVAQLPAGYHDDQAPGRYRLRQDDSPRCFAWANGPQALKPLTFAPRDTVWRAQRNDKGEMRFSEALPQVQPTAVIGVRACDLAALTLQDQHFCYGAYPDHYYNARRRALFIVAVDCAHPAATCFCHSTGDGPTVTAGYDIALTELDEGFLVRAKSERGRSIVEALPLQPATDAQLQCATAQAQSAVAAQTRRLPSRDLKDALMARLDHPRWKDVAQRCLSCANCTSVCPTCFCHSEGDAPDIGGQQVEHYRQWDSCFTEGHSYIHGWVIRDKTRLRYRQWLVHKLGTWHDQFARSGCVGCGRCVAWCPAAIDITEEVNALLAEPDDAQP